MAPLLLATILLGCSDGDDRDSPGGQGGQAGSPSASSGNAGAGPGGGGGAGGAGPDIAWQACPLFSDGQGGDAECATVAVPLDWDDPGGALIDLFVKRVRGAATPERHLWMLNGGPGGPGADFEPVAELLVASDPAVEVYLPDHRGTGLSARLGCDEEGDDSEGGLAITEAEWPACLAAVQAEWGEGLQGFTTTNAARDIAFLIEATAADVPAHVFGGSYGTFWAQRYLQLEPDQAAGVVLVGIAPPTFSFSDYDALFDGVGRDFLAACGADPFCASKLGLDPADGFEQLYAALDAGHCAAAGLDRGVLRRTFAGLIFFSWYERAIVPAVAYRLARCSAADVAALQQFAAVVSAPGAPTVYDRLQGAVLGTHIAVSELWPEQPPPLEELDAVIDGALFSTELARRVGVRWADWPRYDPGALDGAWAETDVPMLMMNGTLDPATPLAPAMGVGEHFQGAGQTFLAIPGASHSFASPWSGGGLCILDLLSDFVRDPGALDTGCAAAVEPLAFEGWPEIAMALFGTGDLWENDVTATAARVSESEVARLRVRVATLAHAAERGHPRLR